MTTNPSEVTYRRARDDDREAVMSVLATANFERIPSPEMPALDLERFFVAESDGAIVGVAGWAILADSRGKTTLLAVDPAVRGAGVGHRLHELRMLVLSRSGCPSVVTNADRAVTIDWYRRHFGYRVVGSVPKVHEYGDPDIEHWTTIEADIPAWHATYVARGGSDELPA